VVRVLIPGDPVDRRNLSVLFCGSLRVAIEFIHVGYQFGGQAKLCEIDSAKYSVNPVMVGLNDCLQFIGGHCVPLVLGFGIYLFYATSRVGGRWLKFLGFDLRRFLLVDQGIKGLLYHVHDPCADDLHSEQGFGVLLDEIEYKGEHLKSFRFRV